MNAEYIKALEACEHRASNLRIALELCTSATELKETLKRMGFKRYEYSADAIYIDGDKQRPIPGVVKLFTQWTRNDEALGYTDVIDVAMGCVKATNHRREWCNSTQLLSLRIMKLL